MLKKNKTILLLLAVLLALCVPAALAQDQAEEEEQPGQKYTMEEYNKYQKAAKEGHASLLGFICEYPNSFLTTEYAIPQYIQMVNELYQKGQYGEAATAGEEFLTKVDSEHFGALYLTAWSNHLSQQWGKATEYGEKALQLKPETTDLFPLLARAYQNAGQIDQAIPYAEKYCASAKPEECWDLLPMVTRHYASQKQWKPASQYAQKTVEAFESAQMPNGVDEQWWNDFVKDEKSLSYSVLGREAFERKNYSVAERNYRAVLNSGAKDKNLRAESYFYIGMSRWRQEQIDPAMEAFAKCSLLKGTPHSDTCHDQLETLYKGTHNGSLAGFEEYLDRQRSE